MRRKPSFSSSIEAPQVNGEPVPHIIGQKRDYNHTLRALLHQGYRLYDLHVHSSGSDGIASIKKIAQQCVTGSMAVAVTDHNMLPRIDCLTDEERAWILPAIELTSSESVDIICYFEKFSDLQTLCARIEPHKLGGYRLALSADELLSIAAECNCVVTIPHPSYPDDRFRSNFLKMLEEGSLGPRSLGAVHCIEVFNSSRDTCLVQEAMDVAARLGKFPIVGSDAHTLAAVGNGVVAVKAGDHGGFSGHCARVIFFPLPPQRTF